MALTKISSDVISANAITANAIAAGSITASQIASVSNTAITGTITSSQIASVANTQITGTITSSQIASVANTQITGTITASQLAPTAQFIGFKNRIINGAMVIDQRNAGASITIPANTVTYTLDRFFGYATQASKMSIQQNSGSITPPVGFSNYLGITSLSAYAVSSGDVFLLLHRIEGFNTTDLAWGTANAKTITISAWVYSSLTGTFGGSLRNAAQNRSYPFSYTVSSANTWTQISVTIPGDTTGTWATNNTTGVDVCFSAGCGSSFNGTSGVWAGANYTSVTGATSVVGTNGATFYITGVQLEVGSTASSFDYRPYGTELALCQRYYEILYSNYTFELRIVNGNYLSHAVGCWQYVIPKRSSPTVSQVSGSTITFDRYGIGTNSASSVAFNNSNPYNVQVDVNMPANYATGERFSIVGGNVFQANAEL